MTDSEGEERFAWPPLERDSLSPTPSRTGIAALVLGNRRAAFAVATAAQQAARSARAEKQKP